MRKFSLNVGKIKIIPPINRKQIYSVFANTYATDPSRKYTIMIFYPFNNVALSKEQKRCQREKMDESASQPELEE